MDVKPYELIRFGAMDVKPYEYIGFGAMDVKPHEFIRFGAMDVAQGGTRMVHRATNRPKPAKHRAQTSPNQVPNLFNIKSIRVCADVSFVGAISRIF
jgi:hypothetical protein